MAVLPDTLKPNLKVVFCGTAASKKSAEIGAPYAGPGNRFWETLHLIGLTVRPLKAEEFRFALDYGIGLTNLAPNAIGNDDILKPTDFDPDGLRRKIEVYQPRILAFTSKRTAQEFYGVAKVEYGFQPESIGETRVYILPSPSGAARGYWDISRWQTLATFLMTED